jgi:hypothetical protein
VAHAIKVVMAAKENIVAKVNIIMKITTTTTKVDLEITTHAAMLWLLLTHPQFP